MKYKLLVHPPEYDLARTEAFYERQAARGWLLKERNLAFSLFEKGEPQVLHYRVEFATQGDGTFFSGTTLPEDQVAWYEECGWRLVTSSGFVNIFSAPEGADSSELYNAPEQQAATLAFARKHTAKAAVFAPFWLVVMLLCNSQFFSPYFYGQVYFLASPALWVGFTLLFFWRFLAWMFRFFGFRALQKQLAAGRSADRAAVKHFHSPWRGVSIALFLCAAVLIIYGIPFSANSSTQELAAGDFSPALLMGETSLPEATDQPFFYGTVNQGQFITFWEVNQRADTAAGEQILSQDLYQLPSAWWAQRLLPRLAVYQSWGTHYRDFEALSVPGFDQAAVSPDGITAVARSGSWLCRVSCSVDGEPLPREELVSLLTALSAQLQGGLTDEI